MPLASLTSVTPLAGSLLSLLPGGPHLVEEALLVEGSRRRTDLLMDSVRLESQRQVQAVGIATKDDLAKLEAKLAKQTKAATKSAAKTTGKSAGKSAGKKAKKKADGSAKQSTKRAAGSKKTSTKAKKTAKAVSTGVASS